MLSNWKQNSMTKIMLLAYLPPLLQNAEIRYLFNISKDMSEDDEVHK